MKLDFAGAKGAVEVSEATFGREFNEALVHQVVTAYAAGCLLYTSPSPRDS